MQISEHLPTVAKQMKHLSIIRSLNSKEGNHDRGTYMMHTGYTPNPTVVHPSFGSVCSYELGEQLENFDLPHCIAINSPGMGAGFLGMAHAPFVVQNPNAADRQPPAPQGDRRDADGAAARRCSAWSRTTSVQQRGARRAATTRRSTPRRSG